MKQNDNNEKLSLAGDPETILTQKEVAALLRVSIATVSNHTAAGRIKCARIGSRRLYRRGDIRAFFENRVEG